MNTNPNNPLILALDTSQPTLCLALLRGAEQLASVVDTSGAPHSQRLFPLLHELLAAQSLAPTDLELLAVNTGPGSFTGLRVGLAAVQGVAATLGIPVLGVNALDAMAAAAGVVATPIVVLIKAARAELFCGVRKVLPDRSLQMIGPDRVAAFAALQPDLRAEWGDSAAVFLGNGAVAHRAELSAANWTCADTPETLAPLIGQLAWQRWQGQRLSPVAAYYIRPSEAEIKFKP
jgi:tRNA threonylcarbamoyladenosine biosynthesis protein TsaB